MSSAHVRATTRAYLAANWALTEIVVDSFAAESRHTLEPWLCLDFPGGSEEQASMGDPGGNAWRESGVVQIHLFVPAGETDNRLVAWADIIRRLYRGQQINRVRYGAADPPQIGPGSEDGQWRRATVAIEYEFDEIG